MDHLYLYQHNKDNWECTTLPVIVLL